MLRCRTFEFPRWAAYHEIDHGTFRYLTKCLHKHSWTVSLEIVHSFFNCFVGLRSGSLGLKHSQAFKFKPLCASLLTETSLSFPRVSAGTRSNAFPALHQMRMVPFHFGPRHQKIITKHILFPVSWISRVACSARPNRTSLDSVADPLVPSSCFGHEDKQCS